MSEQTPNTGSNWEPPHPGDGIDAFPTEESWVLNKRQYAAIHLRVPDSGLDWLDAMIDRARRDEFAEKAMVALVSKFPPVAVAKNDPVYHRNARGGCNYADALLAELDKGVGQ